MRRLLLVLIVAAAVPSCVTMLKVNDFSVYPSDVERSFAAVRNRASFEFDCPKDQLTLTVLNTSSDSISQIGATGCGHKSVYVRMPNTDTWLLNADSPPAK